MWVVNKRAVLAVWCRNALVWRKLAIPSLLGNVADPLMALVAFGYGLGSLLPEVAGRPYLDYLVCGALAMSAMNAATFEALYSAFSRMHVQRTWDAILNTPIGLDEIVLGEWLWSATKSLLSTSAMMVVIALLGLGDVWAWLFGLVVLWLGALMFAAMGLCINARAPSYDFFMFYFTLVITPMTFLSGAFFPRSQLPGILQDVVHGLPLSVLVDAVRAVFDHRWLTAMSLAMLLMVYAALALWVALHLSRRRFQDA